MKDFRISTQGDHFIVTETLANGQEVMVLRFPIQEGREEWVAAYLQQLNLDHLIGWVRSKAAAC